MNLKKIYYKSKVSIEKKEEKVEKKKKKKKKKI